MKKRTALYYKVRLSIWVRRITKYWKRVPIAKTMHDYAMNSKGKV